MRGRENAELVIFKRHSAGCKTATMRLSTTAKRFFWECECPIWIQGRLPSGKKVRRQSTGVNTLKDAKARRAAWLSDDAKKVMSDQPTGYTLADCIEQYLLSRAPELSEKTLGQTKMTLERLRDFCATQNVVYVFDLNVDVIERFKTAGMPNLANTTRATMIYKVRCFLRAAFRRRWIKEPLVDRITAVKAVYEQKQPYADEEVNAILAESERLNGGTHGYAGHPHTFRLLLELMLETGMRVGDAIHFDPRKLKRGEEFWVYTYVPQKQKRTERKRTAEAFISDKLKTAIDQCDWLTPGRRPFHYGSSANPAYLANEVYARMQTIGERCNVADSRPHRLRDTFAVRLLVDGVSLDDVSRLLNHSSVKVTELYYAPWINTRRNRLERVLSERKTRP